MYVLEQYRNSRTVLFRHMPMPRDSKQRTDGTWPNQSRNPLAF